MSVHATFSFAFMRKVGSQKLVYNRNGNMTERRYKPVTVRPIISVFRRHYVTFPADSIVE